MSLAFSQKLSSDTIRCVPVSTLRHALIIKSQNDQCQETLKNCRDSITLLNKLVMSQDTLVKIKTEKIMLYEKNEQHYNETIKTKDEIVDTYKKQYQKQRNLKWVGYGVGVIGFILFLVGL